MPSAAIVLASLASRLPHHRGSRQASLLGVTNRGSGQIFVLRVPDCFADFFPLRGIVRFSRGGASDGPLAAGVPRHAALRA